MQLRWVEACWYDQPKQMTHDMLAGPLPLSLCPMLAACLANTGASQTDRAHSRRLLRQAEAVGLPLTTFQGCCYTFKQAQSCPCSEGRAEDGLLSALGALLALVFVLLLPSSVILQGLSFFGLGCLLPLLLLLCSKTCCDSRGHQCCLSNKTGHGQTTQWQMFCAC